MNQRNKIQRAIPQSGNSEDMMSRLKKYILPIDSEWHQKIEGASEQKAEELKSVLQLKKKGYDFPNEYKVFVKNMGNRDCGFLSEWCGGIATVNELIDLYPKLDTSESDNSFLFGINDIYSAEYYITFLENGRHVITTNFDDDYHTDGISENFEKLLFQIAFEKYEKKYFEHGVCFRNGRKEYKECLKKYSTHDIISIIDESINKFSLQKVWFSDKWHYIGCNESCSVYVKTNYAVEGWILGNDKYEVERISKDICDLLMAKIVDK